MFQWQGLSQNSPGTATDGVTVSEGENERSEAQVKKDQQLGRAIAERLDSDEHVPSYNVQASVTNGLVTLTGKVDNLLAKERAGELARAISGTGEVRNQIDVAMRRRQDSELIGEVKMVLRRNAALKSYRIDPKASDGVVILSGIVSSPHRKYLAETLVKGIRGVEHVENEIRVDLQASRPDEEIQTDVVSGIQWDPALKNPQVRVDVKKGVVTVTGVVESQAALDRIAKDAEVQGAKSVNVSGVEVKPGFFESTGPLQPDRLTPTGRGSAEDGR